MPLSSLGVALTDIASAIRPRGAERIPLVRAVERVLAQDVLSDVDWPPFDTSAMDGYAVRLGDAIAGASVPERAGLVAAGDGPPPPIAAGEVVRVMTGAPIPAGTEAIVPVERARRERGRAGSVVFDV